MTGSPISLADRASASSSVWAKPDAGTARPISVIAALNCSRSSAVCDGLGVGADQLDAEALEHAALDQLHGQVQRGLAAEGRQQGVGPLPLDDAR